MITINEREYFPAGTTTLKIRQVGAEASARWLEKGIADFKVAPLVSLSYGMVYVLAGLVLGWLSWRSPQFTAALAAGFLMIGPVVAVGLYNMSRHIGKGEKPSFGQWFEGLHFNAISLASFALVLGVLMGIWTVIASVIIALFFDNAVIGEDLFDTLLNHDQLIPFLFTYFAGGGLVVSVAFFISAVSAPLMMDKQVDVVTAMLTSIRAVWENRLPMVSWAAVLATLVFLGYVFGFVGLVVTLPIAGHASWHAYRELIGE